jgi:thiaminase
MSANMSTFNVNCISRLNLTADNVEEEEKTETNKTHISYILHTTTPLFKMDLFLVTLI